MYGRCFRPETYPRTPWFEPRSQTAGGMQTELDVSVCGPRGAKVIKTSRRYQLLRWQRMQDGYALTLCAPPYCSPDPGDSRNYFG